MPKEYISYIGPVILLVLLSWRVFRNMRGRPVTPARLWIRPALLFVLLGLAMLHPAPLTSFALAVFAGSALAGAVLGYVLASHQTLSIEPATGAIISKMSPIGIVLFIGLIGLRFAVRQAMIGGDPMAAAHPAGPVLLYTDAGLFFVVALVAAQSWETWQRAKSLRQGAISTPTAVENQAE